MSDRRQQISPVPPIDVNYVAFPVARVEASLTVAAPPSASSICTADPQTEARLARLSKRLDEAKSRLDKFSSEMWYNLSGKINTFGTVTKLLRGAGMAVSTNASSKLLEMLVREHTLGVFASDSQPIRIFCDAELPGAFIVALMLASKLGRTSIDWLASSYYPNSAAENNYVAFGDKYHIYSTFRANYLMGPPPNAAEPEGITRIILPSDEAMALLTEANNRDKRGGAEDFLDLLAKVDDEKYVVGGSEDSDNDSYNNNIEDAPGVQISELSYEYRVPVGYGARKVDFDDKLPEFCTGDLTDPDQIRLIEHRVRSVWPEGAQIYTSDAGLEVKTDYNSQETITLRLNFGQIVAGLLTLARGGTLITKQYTFFTDCNRSIIAFLADRFESLSIVKPATSKSLNSEIYLYGKGFLGLRDGERETLLSYVAIGIVGDTSIVDCDTLAASTVHTAIIAESLTDRQVAILDYAHDFYYAYMSPKSKVDRKTRDGAMNTLARFNLSRSQLLADNIVRSLKTPTK